MYTLHHNGKKLHYLAMPRTASRACRDAFIAAGCEKVGGHHGYKSEVIRDGYIITTVRNHWDWFASFFNHNKACTDFRQFVRSTINESGHIKRDGNTCRLFWKYAPHATHLLRYETLQDDLNRVCEEIGFPQIQLNQVGDAKPQDYREYYNRSTRNLVYRKFRDEMENFGYA